MPATKAELKNERNNLDKLTYAHEVARALFGSDVDVKTVETLDVYLESCDDEEEQQELSEMLKRAVQYACEFFGTDKPTPAQAFLLFDRVVMRDDEEEDEEEDEE